MQGWYARAITFASAPPCAGPRGHVSNPRGRASVRARRVRGGGTGRRKHARDTGLDAARRRTPRRGGGPGPRRTATRGRGRGRARRRIGRRAKGRVAPPGRVRPRPGRASGPSPRSDHPCPKPRAGMGLTRRCAPHDARTRREPRLASGSVRGPKGGGTTAEGTGPAPTPGRGGQAASRAASASGPASHARSRVQRRRLPALCTAASSARRCPISTTSRLPRVTPV